METLVYIVIMFCMVAITAMIGWFLKSILRKFETPRAESIISGPSGQEIGRGIVEALEEEKDRARRDEELRKYAEEKRRGPLPVMTSEPDRDRKIRFDRADILIPEKLTEEEKQLLEDFYGKHGDE